MAKRVFGFYISNRAIAGWVQQRVDLPGGGYCLIRMEEFSGKSVSQALDSCKLLRGEVGVMNTHEVEDHT